jgi:glycosyltransferase involved in cell wall biosynthesis
MAADLQEPPELIEEFFRTLRGEPVDLTLGVRRQRDDPPVSRWSSNVFWAVYRRLVQRDMPVGGIDVFGCNAKVRDVLLRLDESNSSLVGQVIWLGFRRKSVPYRRQERKVGKSGWTFRRKCRYMLDSIFSFTDLPLTLLMLVGSAGLVFAVVVSVVVLAAWSQGKIPVLGYTPLLLATLISMFAQLLGLGIIGGYVWRTFENTKRRPAFIPMSRESFAGTQKGAEP